MHAAVAPHAVQVMEHAAAAQAIPFAEKIAAQGLLGVVIILLILVIRYLEQQKAELASMLQKERDARLDDAKVYRDGVIAVTVKVHESVERLSQVAEILERNTR